MLALFLELFWLRFWTAFQRLGKSKNRVRASVRMFFLACPRRRKTHEQCFQNGFQSEARAKSAWESLWGSIAAPNWTHFGAEHRFKTRSKAQAKLKATLKGIFNDFESNIKPGYHGTGSASRRELHTRQERQEPREQQEEQEPDRDQEEQQLKSQSASTRRSSSNTRAARAARVCKPMRSLTPSLGRYAASPGV